MKTDIIKNSINENVKLSKEEWSELAGHLALKAFAKNEYLLKEGQQCGFVAFVNSGSLIYYKLLENGKEITTDFAFAGEWVTDNYSRLCGTPSAMNIKAIEDTELIILRNENLSMLYNILPKLERIGRILVEQAFIKITQRSIDLQVLSASQRYQKLIEKYPEVLQKIPLYHIANYLGVAPKSLSRIRKG